MSREVANADRLLDGGVLVIDDDRADLRIAKLRLRVQGWVCHIADTHRQALARLETHPKIQVIILDYTMFGSPPASSVVEKIKAFRPEVHIVGHSHQDRRKEFAAMGVQRFLRKPLVVRDLVDLLIA